MNRHKNLHWNYTAADYPNISSCCSCLKSSSHDDLFDPLPRMASTKRGTARTDVLGYGGVMYNVGLLAGFLPLYQNRTMTTLSFDVIIVGTRLLNWLACRTTWSNANIPRYASVRPLSHICYPLFSLHDMAASATSSGRRQPFSSSSSLSGADDCHQARPMPSTAPSARDRFFASPSPGKDGCRHEERSLKLLLINLIFMSCCRATTTTPLISSFYKPVDASGR